MTFALLLESFGLPETATHGRTSFTRSNSEDKPSTWWRKPSAWAVLQGTAVGPTQSVRLCGPVPPSQRQGAKQPFSARILRRDVADMGFAHGRAGIVASWHRWSTSLPPPLPSKSLSTRTGQQRRHGRDPCGCLFRQGQRQDVAEENPIGRHVVSAAGSACP